MRIIFIAFAKKKLFQIVKFDGKGERKSSRKSLIWKSCELRFPFSPILLCIQLIRSQNFRLDRWWWKTKWKWRRRKSEEIFFKIIFIGEKKDLYRKFLFIDNSRRFNEFPSNLHEQKLSNKYHLLLNTSKQNFHQFFQRICHASWVEGMQGRVQAERKHCD